MAVCTTGLLQSSASCRPSVSCMSIQYYSIEATLLACILYRFGIQCAMRRLSGAALLVTISVCLSLSIVCHIISLSTHHWIESAAASSDVTDAHGTFLNLGLWTACFSNYQHRHERSARRYDGCHSLYSDYYVNIRHWLIPRQ